MKKILLIIVSMACVYSANAISVLFGTYGYSDFAKFYAADGTTQIMNGDVSKYKFTVELYLLGAESDLSDITYLATATPSFTTKSPAGNFNPLVYDKITGFTSSDYLFFRAFATFEGVDYYMDLFANDTYGEGWNYVGNWNDPLGETKWGIAPDSFGGTGTAGDIGKWIVIPVPEPATAGLAFAGLALLFRRKRK